MEGSQIAKNFLKLFQQIAYKAAEIMDGYTEKKTIRPDQTTIYDQRIQELTIRSVQKNNLQLRINFQAEESYSLPQNQADSDYTIIIDPIDGTKEFFSQGIYYAFSIALIEKESGVPIVTLMFAPKLRITDKVGAMFWATREGSFLNSEKLQVKSAVDPQQDLAIINHPRTLRDEDPINYEEALKSEFALKNIRQMTASIGYLLVAASQRTDQPVFLVTHMSKLWDVASGAFIAQQAGAAVSYINGQPLFPLSAQVLGTRERIPPVICLANQELYRRVIKAISQVQKTKLVNSRFQQLGLLR